MESETLQVLDAVFDQYAGIERGIDIYYLKAIVVDRLHVAGVIRVTPENCANLRAKVGRVLSALFENGKLVRYDEEDTCTRNPLGRLWSGPPTISVGAGSLPPGATQKAPEKPCQACRSANYLDAVKCWCCGGNPFAKT